MCLSETCPGSRSFASFRHGKYHRLRACNISNNSSSHMKHPGVPDGSDVSDGTSYPLTENQTRPVAQATCPVTYLPCGGNYIHPFYSYDMSRCKLPSPLCGQASFTFRLECGDIYAPSAQHVCYALHRGYSNAVAVYTRPGDVYAFLRVIAICRTFIYV
jgi:hypothetical protein